MKRIVAACALLTLIVLSCILSYCYLLHETEQMHQMVSEASALAQQGDPSGAQQKLNEFQRSWEKRRTGFAMLVRHDEIDEIDQILPQAQALLQAESGGEFLAETAAIMHTLEHIAELESVSLANIF